MQADGGPGVNQGPVNPMPAMPHAVIGGGVPPGILPPGALPTIAPLQAGQVLTPALRHTNFASYYHDTTKDPLQPRYATVIARFDAMVVTHKRLKVCWN